MLGAPCVEIVSRIEQYFAEQLEVVKIVVEY
jgi:hypothetical protein